MVRGLSGIVRKLDGKLYPDKVSPPVGLRRVRPLGADRRPSGCA